MDGHLIKQWAEQIPGTWDGTERAIQCPYHDDKNPSCSINIEKKVFYCHACGEKGTLKQLAARLGIDYPGNGQKNSNNEKTYTYQDKSGKTIYQAVRYYKDGKKSFFCRHLGPGGEWINNIKGISRLPYHLPEIEKTILAGKPIIVCEGEKDCDRIRSLGYTATTNNGGCGKWWPEHSKYLNGARVVIIGDCDKPGQAHVEKVAASLAELAQVKIAKLPFDIVENHGKDVSDYLDEYTREEFLDILAKAKTWESKKGEEIPESEDGEREAKRPKQADLAVQIGMSCDLFHDGDESYVHLKVGNHFENWRLRSKQFKTWLRRQFYLQNETAIGSQALEDGLGILEGKALFEGEEMSVHLRIAGDDKTIYLDLANDEWLAVKITADGWTLCADPAVRFRRTPGMEQLPRPVEGGQLDDRLGCFLNMEPDDRKLFTACLLAAFRPRGPYPVLGIHGEQGSAKSTAAMIFRTLVDPNTANLRSMPREERDLVIAARNGWCVNFDNLSHLPHWVSDALCRISTGAGFGVRQLYSDDAEVLFQAQRPIVLNGIEDLATRGDLLDRSVLVYCPPIDEERRLTERDFLRQFEEEKPNILGALLDAVSTAIRNLPDIKLSSVPRMADFVEWVTAAESALGWEPETFLRLYRQNRSDANTLALEANPLVPVLVNVLQQKADFSWEGTATELLDALNSMVSDKTERLKAWPKNARAVSAIIRRLAPNLRQSGMFIHFPGKNESPRVFRLKVDTSDFAGFCAFVGVIDPANNANNAKTQTSLFSLKEVGGLGEFDDAP